MSTLLTENDFERVSFWVTPVYTLYGRKNEFSLPDMSYGQFVVFENNQPKYYLNSFDKQYEPFINLIPKQEAAIFKFLDNKCKQLKNGLSMYCFFWGISLESKSYTQTIRIKKLPTTFFQDL